MVTAQAVKTAREFQTANRKLINAEFVKETIQLALDAMDRLQVIKLLMLAESVEETVQVVKIAPAFQTVERL